MSDVLDDLRRMRDDLYANHGENDALTVSNAMDEIQRLQKLAGQRGGRMQVMWRWMKAAQPDKYYEFISDHFMWENSDIKASGWFDDDGVPRKHDTP